MRGDQPSQATEVLFSRDAVWLATKMFEALQSFVPPNIPATRYFPEEALTEWKHGGKIPEHLADDFRAWLDSAKYRSDQISEAKRRLRSTMWAQATLIANGHEDFAEHLAEFHRRYWNLAYVPHDRIEREQTVQHVVQQLVGR